MLLCAPPDAPGGPCRRHKAQRMVRNRGSAAAAARLSPARSPLRDSNPCFSLTGRCREGNQPPSSFNQASPPPFSASPKDVGSPPGLCVPAAGRAGHTATNRGLGWASDITGCSNSEAAPPRRPRPGVPPPAREGGDPGGRTGPAARARRSEAGAAPERAAEVPTRQLLPGPSHQARLPICARPGIT